MPDITYSRIRCWFQSRNGQLFRRCLLSVYILGLAAHAYGFLSPIFSHDSLTALYATSGENNFKIALGRMFVPVYRALSHGSIALPWLIGLLALLWIGLSVYFVVRMFHMQSLPAIVFTAGIFVTNATVSAMTATFINELDIDMFALLVAVLSAWCWHKGRRWHLFVFGALLGAISLGLYQSYICVTITLIMLACILRLLNRDSEKEVFLDGLRGMAMLLACAGIYIVLLKLSLALSDVSLASGSYNSITNITKSLEVSPVSLILNAYVKFARGIAKYALRYSAYPTVFILGVNVLLFAFPAIAMLRVLFARNRSLISKLMIVALCLLLPLGMNFTNLLNASSHTLMHFAFSFIYLFAVLVVHCFLHKSIPAKQSGCKPSFHAFSILLAIVLLSNIQASNAMYLKKDLDRQATLSTLTRIADHMEEHEEYEAGKTPVALCGYQNFKRDSSVFDRYDRITGMQFDLQVSSYLGPYQSYFGYILNEPVLLANDEIILALSATKEVQSMPAYPDPGYIRMIDDTLVVKLG